MSKSVPTKKSKDLLGKLMSKIAKGKKFTKRA